MKTLALYNLKGGVGKTTTAVNLAYLAAQEGIRTLVWDLDAQGAATFYLGVKPEVQAKAKKLLDDKKHVKHVIIPTAYKNLNVLPSDFSLRDMDVLMGEMPKGLTRLPKLVQKLGKKYDLLFFDCPPSMSLLAQSVFQAADYLLMPLIPTTLSVHTFQHVKQYLQKYVQAQPGIIAFFSMVDQRKSLHREIMTEARSDPLFCKSFIPTRSIIEKMGIHRAPLPEFGSNSKAAREYLRLWEEIRTKLRG